MTKKILFNLIFCTNLVLFVRSMTYCENGNYTRNSKYRANLDALLSSFPSNIPPTGFYNTSAGEAPDVVSLIFLCRGDLLPDTCRGCARSVAVDILRYCPTRKQAIQYGELCMLRFSDKPISGKLALTPGWQWGRAENATNVGQFNGDVVGLLFQLRVEAVSGEAAKMVATGSSGGPDNQTIYGLVQCTPDLSEMDCVTCLGDAVQYLPTCCGGWRGGSIYRPSCSLRYDTSEFYNRTLIQQPPLSPLQPGDEDSARPIVIGVPVGGGVALVVGMYIFLLIVRRRKQKAKRMQGISSGECLQYNFDTIRDATNNFSEAYKLGQGGFGIIYKGELVDGQEIAVKKLSKWSEEADLDFRNEVLLVARLQHRNLVRLLGFCLNNSHRILVYEFVENASLDLFIFDSRKRRMLDWKTRHKIIMGIAKGLVYLHQDSRLKIVHRDLKLSNVLLDRDMNPKIADFGLARLVFRDATHDSTSRIAGTYGYMPPEYAGQGHFSEKSDVFGYGVMVLEIISGQKNSSFRDENGNLEHLISYAWKNWQAAGSLENVIDSSVRNGVGFDYNEILRCIHISLLCVQENPGDRPTMPSVIHMLSSSSPILPAPSKPGFFLQGRLDDNYSNSTQLSVDVSRNYVSITDMHPR